MLSVGASDDIDAIAWFSSRGPSPQTDQPKPWIVAPGTQILSARPGGEYGLENGTSMASPHVVGTIALLLSANPSLGLSDVSQILAETAVPLTTTHPNDHSGWGRLDAYAAVATQATAGTLTGQVTANGTPLSNIVVTITTPSGVQLPFVTDSNGRYTATLQAGSYTITTEPFGYTQYSANNIAVTIGQTANHPIPLSSLPTGRVEGTVRAVAGYTPLADAHIEVVGTPIELVTDANGNYDLTLPVGSYQLIVRKTGYQMQQATAYIAVNTAVFQPFFLADAPTILLVDTGKWYFASQASYYAEALSTLNYSFDSLTVRNPYSDAPSLDDLSPYDAVIWSSPFDSPGYLGLNNVITDYLGLGGHLFLSGQNIGIFDGVGLDTQLYWYYHLGASFIEKTFVTNTISGNDESLFAGLNFTLNGGSSSNNQTAPDVSAPRANSFTLPAFDFADGRSAGLTAGICTPFRMVYLGFGLEGVPEATDRATILANSFSYFDQPRRQYGIQFAPPQIDELAIPGEQMQYDISVLNQSETLTDTITLSISASGWASSLLTKTLRLGPCESGQTVLSLDVPAGLPPDTFDSLQITAVSQNNPSVTALLPIQHKTPGRILFVDDDRWYDQTAELTAALDSMNLSYDRWDTTHATDSRNGPPLPLLKHYSFVVWYTGYDWFQPITPDENEALEGYLAQGGRLFLTSQDFLYYHHQTKLAQDYFGVADFLETIKPTQLIGWGHTAVSPEAMPALLLEFTPYQNHGDGIIPSAHSEPFFWHDRALPAGTATAGDDWRAVLWAVPFETITPTKQADVMNRVMGWLSDLGDSSFTVDGRVGGIGQPQTYTIHLQQVSHGLGNSASFTNTLPTWLEVDIGSITGGATYNAATRQLTWSGNLPSGGNHTVTYQATPTGILPFGHMLENVVEFYDGNHDFLFTRQATSWLNAPDIMTTMTAVPNQPLAATTITYNIRLQNMGLAPSSNISTVVSLPNTFAILTSTLTSSAGNGEIGDRRLYWEGDLDVGEWVTLSVALKRDATAVSQWVAATALVDDGITNPAFFAQWEYLPVYTSHMPIVFQSWEP